MDLYQATGATTSLGVLAGSEVRYVDRIYSHRSVRTPSYNSDRAPAHRTAIGKVLLAHSRDIPDFLGDGDGSEPMALAMSAALSAELCEVRRVGIAYNREEYVEGVVCVAALVAAGQGQRPPVGIAVSGKAGRLDVAAASEHLRRTAFALSMAIWQTTARTGRPTAPARLREGDVPTAGTASGPARRAS